MDIKGDWKKRAVSGLMVLAMALSLLPTSILAADTRSVTDNAIKNGSFEQPAFDDRPSPSGFQVRLLTGKQRHSTKRSSSDRVGTATMRPSLQATTRIFRMDISLRS